MLPSVPLLQERTRQEVNLARELEEANMMIEEQYASMQDEVEACLCSLYPLLDVTMP